MARAGCGWLGVLSTTPLGPGRSGRHVVADALVALSSVLFHSFTRPLAQPSDSGLAWCQ